MRVLLVEDDLVLGEAVRDQISANGHAVDWVQVLDDAEATTGVLAYDLLLLDLNLSDGDGLDFLKRRRALGDQAPVIIMTARDRISDRIAGLNAGADDYLVKPFDLSELSARIAAVSRRYVRAPNPTIRFRDVEADIAAREVLRDGIKIDLTAREWALLEGLLLRPNAIHTKPALEERLYAFDSEIESNAIEAHVSRLRKKLGRDAIETVWGVGYRLGRS